MCCAAKNRAKCLRKSASSPCLGRYLRAVQRGVNGSFGVDGAIFGRKSAKTHRFSAFCGWRLVEIYATHRLIVCLVQTRSMGRIISKGIESMAKAAVKKKPLTKTEIYNNMAERTGLNKKQVGEFFDALAAEIEANIGKKGPRVFQIPQLCKIVAVDKPALPKRQVRNPATGDMIWADPKPASVQVKVRPLKKLKDMA